MCAHCDKLQTVCPIKSPDDLKAMLLRAADYSDNGTLAEIFPPEAVGEATTDNARLCLRRIVRLGIAAISARSTAGVTSKHGIP